LGRHRLRGGGTSRLEFLGRISANPAGVRSPLPAARITSSTTPRVGRTWWRYRCPRSLRS